MNQQKFCSSCGAALENDDSFCPMCGEIIPGKKTATNKRTMVIVIACGVVTICALIVMLINLFPGHTSTPSPTAPVLKAVDNLQKATNAPVIASPSPQAPAKLNASSFLISTNKKYTYYARYMDGDEGEEQLVAGHLGGNTLIATMYYVPVKGGVAYYMKRSDGIDVVYDSNSDESINWLPDDLTLGAKYNKNGIKKTVLKVNETCDLGFVKLQNCVVLLEEYEAVEHEQVSWYAPSYGCVLETSRDGSFEYKRLTAVEDYSSDTALQEIKNNAINLSKIR